MSSDQLITGNGIIPNRGYNMKPTPNNARFLFKTYHPKWPIDLIDFEKKTKHDLPTTPPPQKRCKYNLKSLVTILVFHPLAFHFAPLHLSTRPSWNRTLCCFAPRERSLVAGDHIQLPHVLKIQNKMLNVWYRLPETHSEFTPENGWLEYHCFLLGVCLFSGANC